MSELKISEFHDGMPTPEVPTGAAVARFDENTTGRDFVVGDLHGMFAHLEALLSEVKFDGSADRLFSVGDLVDRGPDSERALEWLDYPWFHAIRGNHEQFVLDSEDEGQLDLWVNQNGGEWWLNIDESRRKLFRTTFRNLPLAIEVKTKNGEVGIVHADVPPFITWERFVSLLEMRDRDATLYAIWSRNRIAGQGSSMAVTGKMDRIYCGHTPTRTTVQLENVWYIDTGAVYVLDGYEDAKLTLVEISPERHREFDIATRNSV
jgi:serine/threonine protein phosphatase 1